MNEPIPAGAGDVPAAVSALARRYVDASGPLLRLVGSLGTLVENQAERLPDNWKDLIEGAIRQALSVASAGARRTHRLGRLGEAGHSAIATALGAAGGLGGLPTAAMELPATVTMLLRAIQEIAIGHGEDPASEETRLACIEVLGSGGPLKADDGVDTTFLGSRVALAMGKDRLIAAILPRLGVVLGEKLAAQAVPVVGAAAGAAVNLAFARYYQEMAHVHFGLRRLVREGAPEAPAAFRAAVAAQRVLRRG